MPNYDLAVGNSGIIRINDTGTTINLQIYQSDPATTGNISWSASLNGAKSGSMFWGGPGWWTVLSQSVTTDQTVSFTLNPTGTFGFGSGGTRTASITRVTVPPAPNMAAFSPNPDQLTSTGMRVRFSSTGTGNSPIIEWQLQRARNNTFTTDASNHVSSGTTVFTDMSPGQQWFFRARGRNALGWGAWSGTSNATTLNVPGTPGPATVSNITATTADITCVNPASNGGASISGREIQISVVEDFSTVAFSHFSVPLLYSKTGLTRNTQYYVRHRTQNAVGYGGWSPTTSFHTPGTPPTAPTGYVATNIASTSAFVSLGSISDNGGISPSQARVKVSTTASDAGLVDTVTSSWSPVQLTGLTKGTTYYVAQAAFNTALNGGWGPYGSWVSFSTRSDVPNAPVLSLDSTAGDTATISWTTPSDLNGSTIHSYSLRVSDDQGQIVNVRNFSTAAGVLVKIVDLLVEGKTYYATVWAETDKGAGSRSEHLSFQLAGSGSSSGLWLDVSGTPKFCEVWLDVAGTPKLCEVWISDPTGTPRLAVSG